MNRICMTSMYSTYWVCLGRIAAVWHLYSSMQARSDWDESTLYSSSESIHLQISHRYHAAWRRQALGHQTTWSVDLTACVLTAGGSYICTCRTHSGPSYRYHLCCTFTWSIEECHFRIARLMWLCIWTGISFISATSFSWLLGLDPASLIGLINDHISN